MVYATGSIAPALIEMLVNLPGPSFYRSFLEFPFTSRLIWSLICL
jgi:hypothetical protein